MVRAAFIDRAVSQIKWIDERANIGVGTKIFIPFFLVTFTVIGAISYFAMTRISEKIEEMQQRRAAAALNGIINTFGEQAEFLEAYMRLLSDSRELEEAMERNDRQKVYELLAPADYYSGQRSIFVYNRTGQKVAVLAQSSEPNEEEEKVKSMALEGMTGSGLTITERGLELFVGTPVHDGRDELGSRQLIGALVLERHIRDTDLEEIKTREGVEINVFYSGRLVQSTLENDLRTAVIGTLLESIKKGDRFNVLTSGETKQYINTWENVGQDGIISVLVPNDDLLAASRDLSRDISGITVVAGIMVFFSSYLLAKVIVRPLVNMLSITNSITKGDYSKKIAVITRDELGQLGKAINFMADTIKERLEYAEILATIDGLTGLYNHRFFQQRLREEIRRAERYNAPLSLVMLDIDYFKHYNDTQGHPAGDKVLRVISQLIQKNIREVDIAARYGGEEFAVILIDTGPEQAFQIGERIRKEVENYHFEGREEQPTGKLTISLGIACYPVNATKKEDLIKMADDALYKAKYISRNKVVLYYSVLDELKNELNNSEQDMISTIKTLISVINSKDKYTYGHVERVVHYSVRLAEAMGLSEGQIKTVRMAAYLHDIGKIEIERELLNKEGPLNDAERKILGQHPSWGAQIISPVKSLQELVPVILFHHEKYDGTGYPLGMKGSDIPLAARILKVADSFDAMTSARPYQSKKTVMEARDELIRCAGSDFDPLIVQEFNKIIDSLDVENDRLLP